MLELRQFVPSLVCLSCPVCCRFSDPASRWRPRVGTEEQAELDPLYRVVNNNSPAIEPDGYLTALTDAAGCRCLFFYRDDQTCSVYNERPFECQLYPFLLVREKNQRKVAAHLACPFVERYWDTPVVQAYVDYLKSFFVEPVVSEFLSANPSLFGDYADEDEHLEILFDLPAE